MIGYENIKSKILSDFAKNKMHHATILYGKKGMGKATFSKLLCLELLNSKNNFHPDLLLIEKEEQKKEIGVDKIRAISDFSNQTHAQNDKKFIIIDSACELNKSSANSLLKILEEPKNSNYLILIAHNFNKIIPTIRSRCSLIKIDDFSKEQFNQILQNNNITLNEEVLILLSEMCENSPALAISMHQDLLRVYQLFIRSIINKKISDELIKKISDKNFAFIVFERVLSTFFNRLIKNLNRINLNLINEEQESFHFVSNNLQINNILELVQKTMISFNQINSLYLDKKLFIINIFNSLCHEKNI